MRGYLFSSKKVLTAEIISDLSAFPEKLTIILLTIILVNCFLLVDCVPNTASCITRVTLLHPRSPVTVDECTSFFDRWEMRDLEPLHSTWGQRQDSVSKSYPAPIQAASLWTDTIYNNDVAGVCVSACTHRHPHVSWREGKGRFAKKLPKSLFHVYPVYEIEAGAATATVI